MMTIAEAISDLLFVRDTVVVPGLGAFMKKPMPAIVDLETNRLAPPSCRVEFDPSLREENDLVARYLTENEEVSADDAARRITSFVADCFNTLKSGKSFLLEGLGELAYDANGRITFSQDGSVNYNSDAFGLTAFTAQPVIRHKTKEELKAEIEEEQRLKNTPVTVDEEAIHEGEPDNHKTRTVWYWATLAACVLIGVFFGLRQFSNSRHQTPEPAVAETSSGQAQAPVVTQDVPPVTPAETPIETPSDTPTEIPSEILNDSIRVASFTLTREVPVTQYRVVGGCYDREENAVWFANILYGVGFKEAFYERHGERWFVVFAPYATYDEALEALMNIRTNTTYQAWIQVPQEQ